MSKKILRVELVGSKDGRSIYDVDILEKTLLSKREYTMCCWCPEGCKDYMSELRFLGSDDKLSDHL